MILFVIVIVVVVKVVVVVMIIVVLVSGVGNSKKLSSDIDRGCSNDNASASFAAAMHFGCFKLHSTVKRWLQTAINLLGAACRFGGTISTATLWPTISLT